MNNFIYRKIVSGRQRFFALAMILLVTSLSGQLHAQTTSGKIDGIVIEESGAPVSGTTIYSRDARGGAVTDRNGQFSVRVNPGDQLTVSFLGYEEQKIDIVDSRPLTVVLVIKASEMDEVVVVGYGTQTRREVTSAISKVSGSDLNKVVNTSISSALKGKTTGMRIFSKSGAPGEQATITIRGGSSINKNNDALVLIDGMLGSLSNVNPQDVQSIEVLKDAASTAIYGSRASNGIVLVTTKEGSQGRPTVTANISYGFQSSYKNMDKLNSIEYLNLVRPALARSPQSAQLTGVHPAGTNNGPSSSFSTRYLKHGETMPAGWKWIYDPLYPNDPSKVLIFEDNDLQDLVFEGGRVLNAYVGVNGGTERSKYMVSLGYVGDNSFTPNRKWNSLTLRSNMTYNLAKRLKLTSNLSGQRITSTPYAKESSIFSTGMHLAPTIKSRMEDGTIAPGKDSNYRNPLYIVDKIVNKKLELNMTAKLGLEWEIIDGLTAKGEGFYSAYYAHREYFEKSNIYNSLRPSNYYGDIDQVSQFDATLNYTKTFAEHHRLSAVGGFSALSYNIYDYDSQAEGGSRDDLTTANASSIYKKVNSKREREMMNSLFGRVSYGYKMKYLVTLTFRADASSKFAKSERWALFPGISAGYVITEEDFMKDVNWLSMLKVRASYGQTGNNGVGRYDYQGVWTSTTSYLGETSFAPSSIPNRALTWEKSDQFDVGLDIGLLKDRITLGFDYYNKVTNNLIFNDKLPNTGGFDNVNKNVGQVRFWGYEASIDARIINSRNFSWDFGANISYNMNKVLKLPYNGNRNNRIGGLNFPDDQSAGLGGIAEGERMYGIIGYNVSYIIDNDTQASSAMYDERSGGWDPATKQSQQGRKFAGDYEWMDKNDDGRITPKDQYILGYLIPTTTGGFNTSFRFKNVELYASFDFALGHHIYDRQVSLVNAGTQQGHLTPTRDMLDSWSEPGNAGNVKFARFDVGDGESTGQWNHYRTSDKNVFKGDYLSFRELKLSYDLSNITNKYLGIKGFTIYASGQNIYCFTKYPGYMTEYSGSGRNLGDGNYPLPRIWSIGLNITF